MRILKSYVDIYSFPGIGYIAVSRGVGTIFSFESSGDGISYILRGRLRSQRVAPESTQHDHARILLHSELHYFVYAAGLAAISRLSGCIASPRLLFSAILFINLPVEAEATSSEEHLFRSEKKYNKKHKENEAEKKAKNERQRARYGPWPP
ncbi:hypothetical protein QE152_g1404 [Popillia japonica]|uniref:Uncharacterized protein n=1 Tax=Popillia japonica TaxID=7064 RepID=A0AAW1N9R6_POPJA